MLSKKKIVTLAVVGVIIATIAYFSINRGKVTYTTEAVSRGAVVEKVSVTGSIAAMTKINLQPEAGGKVVKIFVKEGDEVRAGDKLIQIDAREAASAVAAQQAAVDSAVARLNQLLAGATAEELHVSQTAVDTAQAQLDAALGTKSDAATSLENALANQVNVTARAAAALQSKIDSFVIDYDQAAYVAGDAFNRLLGSFFNSSDYLSFACTNSQFQTDAESTRVAARAAVARLRDKVTAVKANVTESAVEAAYVGVMAELRIVNDHANAGAAALNYSANLTSSTLATYQLNANTAQTNMNTAMQELTTDQTGLDLQRKTNATDLTNAEIAVSNARAALANATNAVETAKRALAQAQANLDLKKAGVRPEEIAAQQATVNAQKATLESLQTALAKRTVTASIDAVVAQVPVELGETVTASQVVAVLNTQGKFEIVANVSEIDIAKVKVDDKVDITLDAFQGGERWQGHVVSIQPAEKVVEGVVFYETKIVFDQEDERLRPGMTANLEIESGRVENALRASIRAVKDKAGQKSVQILVDGKPQDRQIKTGLENTDYVEVLSGLAEGELVITGTGK